jgi:CrcB protein
MTVVYVALLGAIGSLLRWGLSVAVQKAVGPRFPAGTLTVNVIGSAVIGFVMALYIARNQVDARARIAITTGLLGGFTTYSSFAWDTLALIEKKSYATACAYLCATVAVCLLGCWGGAVLARAALR